jgi:hypothetical protein
VALLQIRFCKKILGIFFFCDAVDTDIHEELKNKITTTGAKRLQLAQLKNKKSASNFAAKDRICNSAEVKKVWYIL